MRKIVEIIESVKTLVLLAYQPLHLSCGHQFNDQGRMWSVVTYMCESVQY